jgi:lysophospholipase L1-like esterase
MVDYIRPALRHKPDKIIVMSGTNDFRYNIDTLHHAKEIIKLVKDTAPNVKLALAEICMRKDKHAPPHKDIADINNKIKQLCQREQIDFIKMDNFDFDCLSKGKLHPNDDGNRVLKKNFLKFMNSR